MAQEEEQHGHRQHQADDAGFGQFPQRVGDVFALIADQDDLDAVELGLLDDAVDLGHGRLGGLDQVGIPLAEDVQADGRLTLEAAAEVHARRLQAHVGDLLQAKAVCADDEFAQLAQVAQFADRLHTQAAVAVVDHAGRHREVHRLQAPGELVEADAVGGEPVRVDRDLDLARRRAGDVDAGDTRHPFQPARHLAFDQVVGAGQVARAAQAHAQHRLVGGGELEHLVALEVVRQVAADGVDALARLRGQHFDVATPVGELDEHTAAIGPGIGLQALDALESGQRLLDRAHDAALDLLRGRARIRQLDVDAREIQRRELLQRQPERGDQSDDDHGHEEHDHRHRPPQAEFDDAHACDPSASPWPRSSGRVRAT